MSQHRPAITLTAGVLATIMAVSAASVVVHAVNHPDELPWFEAASFIYFLVPVAAFVAVGLAILRRKPTQPIGWIAAILGIGGVVNVLAGVYALHDLAARDWLVWLAVTQGMSIWALFALMLLLFPTGRTLTRRWRSFGALVVFFAVALTIVGALAPWEYQPEPARYTASNPIGLPGGPWSPDRLDSVSFLGALLVPIAAASLIARWRRSSGDERQQLKWLGQAGLVLAIAASAVLVSGLVVGQQETDSAASLLVGNGLVWTAIAALPVTIGLAVTRYRLYDVDRVISRTLAYAVVTIVLAGMFVALVAVPQAFVLSSNDAGSASGVLVVSAATLAAAAIFNPLRRRMQAIVDRRFARTRYSRQVVVAEFNDRLREPRDLDSLVRDVAGVVGRTLAPKHVGVWTRVGRR